MFGSLVSTVTASATGATFASRVASTLGETFDAGAQHRFAPGGVEVEEVDTTPAEHAAARPTVFGMSCSFRSAKTRKPLSCKAWKAAGPASA